jgi:hypothetical protein
MKMQVGRFIYDKRTLDVYDRVFSAAKEYKSITGHCPNLAHVNPKHLEGDKERTVVCDGESVLIVGDHSILMDIAYVGMGK